MKISQHPISTQNIQVTFFFLFYKVHYVTNHFPFFIKKTQKNIGFLSHNFWKLYMIYKDSITWQFFYHAVIFFEMFEMTSDNKHWNIIFFRSIWIKIEKVEKSYKNRHYGGWPGSFFTLKITLNMKSHAWKIYFLKIYQSICKEHVSMFLDTQ